MVEPSVDDPTEESVRLGGAAGPRPVADVIVVSERDAKKWGDVRGSLIMPHCRGPPAGRLMSDQADIHGCCLALRATMSSRPSLLLIEGVIAPSLGSTLSRRSRSR